MPETHPNPLPKKTFVLDTNVLLHNPNALFAFADNHVVIPIVVLEELDRFKTGSNELARNSREVGRILDRLRNKGSLGKGVPVNQGGCVQVVMQHDELKDLLPLVNDNLILGAAHYLKRQGFNVIFVSKDINARIKSDAIGITCEDFKNQKVDIDTLYTGWQPIVVGTETFDRFNAEGRMHMSPDSNAANSYAMLVDRSDRDRNAIGRYHRQDKQLVALDPHPAPVFGLTPRNLEQRMALDLLMDDRIPLVTLLGTAGTGKTLMALAVGMQKVLTEDRYKRLLVSRPIIPLGKDIGYLPGTKDDKLSHWMGPIFDNLEFLLGERPGRQEPRNGPKASPEEEVQGLVKDGVVSLEALTYIRGRSISNHFMVVDEAQNLTPHEIKTIISRAGEGTKVVLTGDPYQIDNPYLDSNSNGLTYVVERLRGQTIAGHLTLTKSERSTLAALAADLL